MENQNISKIQVRPLQIEDYQQLAQSRPEVRFGGRLGSYRYYNMDQVIRAALDDAREELAERQRD